MGFEFERAIPESTPEGGRLGSRSPVFTLSSGHGALRMAFDMSWFSVLFQLSVLWRRSPATGAKGGGTTLYHCGAPPRLLHSSQGAALAEAVPPMQSSFLEWRAQEGGALCNASSSPFATGLGPTGPMAPPS